jgi:hypothetical protein
MSITVTNKGTLPAEFAINRWGSGGSEDYFRVLPSKSESWYRTDGRGFVMSVRYKGSMRPYYVQAGDSIEFIDGQVKIHGSLVNPLSGF